MLSKQLRSFLEVFNIEGYLREIQEKDRRSDCNLLINLRSHCLQIYTTYIYLLMMNLSKLQHNL